MITMIKTILYIIVAVMVMWALDGVRINEIFKKNRYWQSRVVYLMILFSLTYLVVNFMYDFLNL